MPIILKTMVASWEIMWILEANDDEKAASTEESLFLPPPLMAMAELFLTNSILEAMAMGIYKKSTFKQ